MGGITNSGWKLVYNDKPNVALREHNGVNVNASLGFNVNSSGNISDVIPGSPAARAGIVPGGRLIAVNGRHYSADVLKDAVKESATAKTPMELIVEQDEFYSVRSIDYHGGARYPHLERIAGTPDLLEQLGKPLAAAPKK
jgi:predicted metalloprotease with PDZ domain